ncbi:polyketide cyclase [Deltaproteobacteria bacterium Smac51]|nr:polyketide cyclase [Deltaproteobacteria bacterium Smac51]
MHNINWPEKYLPGMTDNFVSNEMIVRGLAMDRVWEALINTSLWPRYYDNASGIVFTDGFGPKLKLGSHFKFITFGFLVESEVVEFVAPAPETAGRLAWSGLIDGGTETEMNLLHAWLIEELPGGRLRVLTQESQIGRPAREMAVTRPNPMLNAHQKWLDGLKATAFSQ